MGKEIFKTTLKRETGKLYYVKDNAKTGFLSIWEAKLIRDGRKKK